MTARPPRELPGVGRASHRLALKIAARSSLRSLGRSSLIIALVALPIAGLAGIAVVYDSNSNPTVQERITTELGQTEAQLRVSSPPSATLRQVATSHSFEDQSPSFGEFGDPVDELPAGTRILATSTTTVTAETATGSGSINVLEGPSWDESFEGKYDLMSGRAPRSDSEVLVTASLLPRLAAKVGDTVELRSAARDSVTIVGILDDQTRPDADQWIFARAGALSGAEPSLDQVTYYLPDTEVEWTDVRELNAQGITAVSKHVLLDPPPAGESVPDYRGSSFLAIAAMVAAFAAFEVILLAGAAFTVTARQQQRTLATIASVGAPRRLVFRILAANGIVLGFLGGLVGVAVGIGGAAVFMAATSDGSATQYFGFHVPWLALLGFVVFAVVIGWIASLVPARAASRFDIVAALRGARKPPPPSKRKPIVGLAMLITGVALTFVGGILFAILLEAGRVIPYGHPLLWVPIVMLIVGPILAQLGLVLCGPLVLTVISRMLRRSGLGARLASRDAARNPSRAVPALAAVMTTVFVAVLAMSLIAAGQLNSEREHMYRYALGQFAVPLEYVTYERETGEMSTSAYENADGLESSIRGAVEVDELRTIASVADPYFWDEAAARAADDANGGTGFALPAVPPTNQCPNSPLSTEYPESLIVDDGMSPEYIAFEDSLREDWRCMGHYLSMSGATGGHLMVGDAADLALVLDREPSAAAKSSLANGGAVSLYPHYVDDGIFTIEWWPALEASSAWERKGSPIRSEALDAVVELPKHPIHFGVFISKETADSFGLEYRDSMLLGSTVKPFDTAQRDALTEVTSGLPDGIYVDAEMGPPQYADVLSWALLGLSGLIAIASAAVAIGLARFDGRQDDATLAALGAGHVVRRSFAFWQALIIAGVGTLLGAGMGLVPAFALDGNSNMPFSPPWLQIGLIVVALPLLIACGSWLFAGRSKVSARRMSIA